MVTYKRCSFARGSKLCQGNMVVHGGKTVCKYWLIKKVNLTVLHNQCETIIYVSMGAFPWDDPDQDQWSEITPIMVRQMNRWIHSEQGFIGSFDLPWSEWSRITDPDPDHLKGTHIMWHDWHIYFLLFVLLKEKLSMTKKMEPFCQKATQMTNKYKLTF